MENSSNSDNVDNYNETIFDEYGHNDSLSNALEFLRRRLFQIKVHNYKCKRIIRFLRKNLKLNKSPKKKGYGQFFTDEEKRYFHDFHVNCFLLIFFLFLN